MRLIFAATLSFCSAWAYAGPVHILTSPTSVEIEQVSNAPVGGKLTALAIDTDIQSAQDGVWSQQTGHRVWQLTVQAAEAKSLALQIEAMGWSDQTVLVLRGARSGHQQKLTTEDLVGHRLWTAQFPGESIQLVLSMPLSDSGELRISTAYYGIRQAQAKHGNCNIDVACPNNDDAAAQIDSTVLLQYAVGNGLSVCSGFLVNNMRADRAPYILTADHCQINRSVQDSVRVYWKFQDDQCGNPPGHNEGDPDDFPSIGGVEVLAEGQNSDFTLLVLGSAENPRAIPQSFNPYWSGWNVGSTPAQSGLSVHHPNGDEKSISRFSQTLLSVREDIDGRPTDSWQVVWDSGTTQPGSSGSGLWNAVGQAVGVLSGGGASCSSQDEPDFYGRLNRAWEEGSSCEKQLKFWLDPDGSGAASMNGLANGNAGSPRIPVCKVASAGGGSSSGSVSPFLLFILFLGLVKKTSCRRAKL